MHDPIHDARQAAPCRDAKWFRRRCVFFTRRQIAEAVSTHFRPLSEASLDDYVASLRDQLGVFHDYVQAVPHVGYRFKA